ncbi:MAG: ATP-binding protein [Thermodesulfobacteriota bacterium]
MIFGAAVLVVLLTLAFTAIFLQRSLREQSITQVRETLFQELAVLKEIVRDRWAPGRSPAESDHLADDLGARLNLRVTLVAPDGTVVGDSDVPLDRLGLLENHAGRPEIKTALAEGRGWSLRRSSTVALDLIYAAELLGNPGRPELVLRLAMPLAAFDRTMDRLWRLILWASVLGLLLSLGVAYLVSHHLSRPLRELTRTALNISAGDLTRRVRRYPKHEVGDLGRAFDQMADHLQEEIVQVTQARDRLEAILRGMVEGVLVTDAAGHITQANRVLHDMLDLETYPVGRTPAEILRSADLIEAFQRVAGGAPATSLEITTRGKNPRTLEVEIAALPGEGPRAGTVAVFHDVTERRRVDKMRRDFVANVSHELRNPLAAVKGAAETLLGGALEDKDAARRFAEAIHRQTLRLEGIVLDLLELARLESGGTPAVQDEFPVKTLIEASRAAVADLAAARGVALELDLPDPDLVLRGDFRELEQALVNLLDNALKYTDSGGRVTLAARREEGKVILRVTDTGVGIPAEHLPRIFERFYRVDKNRSRELGGTGLGLAIVKHVAQAHGGKVEVVSFPGRGSTFTLILPDRPKSIP